MKTGQKIAQIYVPGVGLQISPEDGRIEYMEQNLGEYSIAWAVVYDTKKNQISLWNLQHCTGIILESEVAKC